MPLRLAPLALVMAAACHSAPNAHDAEPAAAAEQLVLIGTWERRVPFVGTDLPAHQGPVRPTEGLVRTETFHADGRWSSWVDKDPSRTCGTFPYTFEIPVRADGIAAWPIRAPLEVVGTWTLVSGPPNIVVEIVCPYREVHPVAQEFARGVNGRQMAFTVIGPNELATTRLGKPARMVRVPDMK